MGALHQTGAFGSAGKCQAAQRLVLIRNELPSSFLAQSWRTWLSVLDASRNKLQRAVYTAALAVYMELLTICAGQNQVPGADLSVLHACQGVSDCRELPRLCPERRGHEDHASTEANSCWSENQVQGVCCCRGPCWTCWTGRQVCQGGQSVSLAKQSIPCLCPSPRLTLQGDQHTHC